jgi:cobalt-precorrin 5A hydrolase
MKIAIIYLTSRGQKLAQQLSRSLEDDHTVLRTDLFCKNVARTLKHTFNRYDCILGIMASGIMVRSICPLIKTKIHDPAVLVMDENGKQVISLLSGHYGGGNDFTLKIAYLIGADPVITTATDVQGKLGVDSLARRYYLYLDEPKNIRTLNQALVEGKKVKLALPPGLEYIFKDQKVQKSYNTSLNTANKQIEVIFNDKKIILTQERLVVGLGARKDISGEAVLIAIKEALQTLELPLKRIDTLATAEPKQDERGILKAADILGLPLEIVSLDQIKEFKHPDYSPSTLVKKTFGVGGICEPAALIAAGTYSQIIYRKKAINKVTVAVAVSRKPYRAF